MGQNEKAELFNEYFQSMYSNFDYESSSTTTTDTNEFSIHFNCEESKLALESLQNQKGICPDNLGNMPLKSLKNVIPKPLLLLFKSIDNKKSVPETMEDRRRCFVVQKMATNNQWPIIVRSLSWVVFLNCLSRSTLGKLISHQEYGFRNYIVKNDLSPATECRS